MADAPRVEIKCKAGALVRLQDLKPLQGDLKTLSDANYAKLRREILRGGFSSPFLIWKDGGIPRLLDGHQRLLVLRGLESEGADLPELFPAVEVDAADEAEARRKLLSIASQYGKVTRRGMQTFLDGAGLAPAEAADFAHFDAVDLEGMAREAERASREMGQALEDSDRDSRSARKPAPAGSDPAPESAAEPGVCPACGRPVVEEAPPAG